VSSSYDAAIIDTAMIQHPDLVVLPVEVQYLYVQAVVWSRLNRTDGLIQRRMIPWFSRVADPEAAADALVASGRWEDGGPGECQIVGFLDSQMSAEKVAQKRDDARARKERFDARTRSERVPNSVQNDVDPTRPDPKGRGEGDRARSAPSGLRPSVAPLALVAETVKAGRAAYTAGEDVDSILEGAVDDASSPCLGCGEPIGLAGWFAEDEVMKRPDPAGYSLVTTTESDPLGIEDGAGWIYVHSRCASLGGFRRPTPGERESWR
jgi:hypothetical protein